MSKWATYLNERSPLPALSFIAGGIALSSMAMKQIFDPILFFISMILNILILIQMRLGDEIKDYEKDKIIHPERPLPRGLLTVKEVFTALILILFTIIGVGIIIGFTKSWESAFSLIFSTLFAWLMFKEFYIGHFLAKGPMTYALTHQLIVFPIHAWVGLAIDPELLNNKIFQGWLIANFGASFTFEICRKLDPNAHKLAGTYAHHYGRFLTTIFVTLFILISSYGVKMASYEQVAWPALALLLFSVILWSRRPDKYKLAAGLSALSSIIILWAPAIKWAISIWSR